MKLFGSTLSSFSSRSQTHFYSQAVVNGKDMVQCSTSGVDTMLFTVTFLWLELCSTWGQFPETKELSKHSHLKSLLLPFSYSFQFHPSSKLPLPNTNHHNLILCLQSLAVQVLKQQVILNRNTHLSLLVTSLSSVHRIWQDSWGMLVLGQKQSALDLH